MWGNSHKHKKQHGGYLGIIAEEGRSKLRKRMYNCKQLVHLYLNLKQTALSCI